MDEEREIYIDSSHSGLMTFDIDQKPLGRSESAWQRQSIDTTNGDFSRSNAPSMCSAQEPEYYLNTLGFAWVGFAQDLKRQTPNASLIQRNATGTGQSRPNFSPSILKSRMHLHIQFSAS